MPTNYPTLPVVEEVEEKPTREPTKTTTKPTVSKPTSNPTEEFFNENDDKNTTSEESVDPTSGDCDNLIGFIFQSAFDLASNITGFDLGFF